MRVVIYILIHLLFTRCAASANLSYFDNLESMFEQEIEQGYDLKIQKDDIVTIKISSEISELLLPFTEGLSSTPSAPLQTMTSTTLQSSPTQTQSAGCSYLVNSAGEITYPLLGVLEVEGLTHSQLAQMIRHRVIEGGYVNDLEVSVELQNFKVSVLGEVKTPGVYSVNSHRLTIFDALGLAGDLTIYGVRDNVSIIREEEGVRRVIRVDVANKEIFSSPYYYLKPNDIIYVEPNKKQKRQSSYNSYILSGILSGISVLFSVLTFMNI